MSRPIENAKALASELATRGIEGVDLMAVLGSGLGEFAEVLENPLTCEYDDLEHVARSTVPGHAGRFVFGELNGVRVLVQQGRIHLYEGNEPEAVTRAVRAGAALGARGLLLTNAAGGLVPDWRPPTLMRIEDHLNMQGCAPLQRSETGRGTPYDPRLGEVLETSAREEGVELQRGVYAALLGPTYETPAEVAFLRSAGADAVGMSTALEALVGDAAGMAVAGVSCISNPAAGISPVPLSHDEVVQAGAEIAPLFRRLLERAIPAIAAALPG